MGRADLHLHTTCSDGMGTVPAVLEATRRAGLDLIAITDHDELTGALQARDLAPRYGVGVIPGIEITTAELWTIGFRRLMRQHFHKLTFAYSSQYQLALGWDDVGNS